MIENDKAQKDHDDIYDKLKTAIRDESMVKHKWDPKAETSLVGSNMFVTLVITVRTFIFSKMCRSCMGAY